MDSTTGNTPQPLDTSFPGNGNIGRVPDPSRDIQEITDRVSNTHIDKHPHTHAYEQPLLADISKDYVEAPKESSVSSGAVAQIYSESTLSSHAGAPKYPEPTPSYGVEVQKYPNPVLKYDAEAAEAQKYAEQRYSEPLADVDDSNSLTITAVSDIHNVSQPAAPESTSSTTSTSTTVPLADYPRNYSHSAEQHRPSTSYSDTAYHGGPYGHAGDGYGSRFQSPSDMDTPPRQASYNSGRETHASQPNSRPSSTLGQRYPNSEGGARSATYQEQNQRSSQQPQQEVTAKNTSVVIKVGMVGDAQIGKTSLMVKYVEGSWDEDYIQTLGVNFMEKTISIRNTEITFSIWDLGGQREFVNMLPLVCNDAVAILFMFDLTRKSTLNSIKEWYRQGRGFNKTAIPFLIGTKYDHFVNFPREEQEEISNQAMRFAKAMKASLIFSSTSHSINVQKIFKIVLSKAFDLKCTIPEISNVGEPLLLYQTV